MGNNKSRMSLYFLDEEIYKATSNQKQLIDIFKYFQNNNGIIDQKSFTNLIHQPNHHLLSEELFKLFKSSPEGLAFNDFKIFYTLFKSTSSNKKVKCCTEMIFGDSTFIEKDSYIKRINLFFTNTSILPLLSNENFLKDIIITNENDTLKERIKSEWYSKDLFLKKGNKMFKEIQFVPDILCAKKVKDDHSSSNYICDCILNENTDGKNKENNKEEELKISEAYDKMKPTFNYISYDNNGVFPIEHLKEYFNKIAMKKELQNVIVNYLKTITQKPFIDFVTFKSFMQKCNNSSDQISMFIFEMIFYPNKDQGYLYQIENALNIKLPSSNNDKVKITDAINYKENILSEFLLQIENINIIPYAYFKMIPLEIFQAKQTLSFIMKNMTWEEYLFDRIEQEKKCYAIAISFWEKIISAKDETMPKIIENKSLSNNGIYLVESHAHFRKNFIILPESIYAYFKRWFALDKEFSFDVVSRHINDKPKEFFQQCSIDDIIKNKGSYIEIIKGDKIYEIELFPIHFYYITVNDIYKLIKDKWGIYNKFHSLLSDLYQNEELKRFSYFLSDRTTFAEIKANLLKTYDNSIKLYLYYNNQLQRATESNTIKQENIKSFCILLIDTIDKEHNDYYYHLINPPMKNTTIQPSNKSASIVNKIISNGNNTTSEPSTIIKDRTLPLGIRNIGNTCYFNSVLQIFFNLPTLTTLFSTPQISYFINYDNEYGQKGKFINKYMSLVLMLQQNEIDYKIFMSKVSKFKTFIGKINNQFNNYDQQDANEFFIFLLETLHEELNLKSKREYIINPSKGTNTEEQISNLNFANSLRRGASFIDALFLFQLKSNLQCIKCHNEKLIYETNYILDIPVMVDTMIEIEVILYRLPIELKVYYDLINDEFAKYNNKNCNRSYSDNLTCYTEENMNIDDNLTRDNYYQSKRNMNVPIVFKMKCDRNVTAESLIKRIRNIKSFELEPNGDSKIIDSNAEDNIKGDKNEEIVQLIKTTNNEMTTLLIYRLNGTKVSMETIIDDCFPSEFKCLTIHEHLNTNGLMKYMHKPIYDMRLIRHKIKGSHRITGFDNHRKKQSKVNDCLSVSDYLSYYSKQEINQNTIDNSRLYIEYTISIEHYCITKSNQSPFYPFHHSKLDFGYEWIIINNTSIMNITPKVLYDIIWINSKRMLKSPRKSDDELWWRCPIKSNNRICYPFVLRYCLIESQEIKCAKCPWYSFCPGCIINPYKEKVNSPMIINSNMTIVVDWCNDLIKNELVNSYFSLKYTYKEAITTTTTTQSIDNDESSNMVKKCPHTLKECFVLFCDKEKLEDQIYCDQCTSHQFFIKNYDLCKPPPVLVISLKRFKFNEYSHYKIRTFIDFPINDLIIKGEEYDLYGIINHYGSISGGHYTSMIKCNGIWMEFNDSHVRTIDQNVIITADAYMLVYLSKKSPMNYSYFYRISSILNGIDECDDNCKKLKVKDDKTFCEGEPVITDYGRGYCIEEIKDDRLIIPIKFAFGEGFLNRERVIKETVLDIKPKIIIKDDNDSDKDNDDKEKEKYNKNSNKPEIQNKYNNEQSRDCIII